MNATYKKLSKQYRKNGNGYVDYQIGDEEGFIKSVSPRQWVNLKLEDRTNDYQTRECYSLLVASLRSKKSLSQFIDLTKKASTKGINWREDLKEFYLMAIN